MFPSECVLERRVRTDGDNAYHRDKDLAATYLPLFILKCEDRKAEGYADDHLELNNQRLERMALGVRLADAPPAVSYLVILHSDPVAEIVAVDKTVIVVSLDFPDEDEDEDEGQQGCPPLSSSSSYLIYDAVALSLRMIPQPENIYSGPRVVSIARPCHGGDYALVRTGMLIEDDEDRDADDENDSLFLWRPSSSLLPWSEKKTCSFPDASVYEADTEFSFNGHAYWVDLECGVSYCSCDALLDDTTSVVEVGGFIHLPIELFGYHRNSQQVGDPCAYRAMGVVCDSFIRLVSIDGLKKKKRTVTAWRLLGHHEGWEKEHEFSMETFQGFRNLPKDLAPIFPLLSTKDADVMYLALGEYQKFRDEEYARDARYLLAVDMRKKMVTSVRREDVFPEFVVSGGLSREALVGPCDDGVPIPIPMKNKKKKRRRHGGNVAEASIPMMKPRMNKHIRFS